MPYNKQLKQLIILGTIRPLLDEYSSESGRKEFIENYAEILMEGMEVEHLVSDPNGAITVDDIGDTSLVDRETFLPNDRFSIKTLPYGTDEFRLTRSLKARELYRAWNIQKSGRARYEELMFKKGHVPLKDEDVDVKGKKSKIDE